ncbi:hypothetical protein V8C42DRAFT_316155 [Trichoderma barbatum]
MESKPIIFYDLAGRVNKCYSNNTWKTRFVLNYKDAPYEVVHSEYPDIEDLLVSKGVKPNAVDEYTWFPFTLPAVTLPDGSTIQNSRAIVDELERLFPTPSMRLDNGYTERAMQLAHDLMMGLGADNCYRLYSRTYNPRSTTHFNNVYAPVFKVSSLSELANSPLVWDGAWASAQEALKKTKELFDEHPEGPFVEGTTFSYADCLIGGVWQWLRVPNPEMFERVMSYDETFRKHQEALAPYLERDGC